MKSQLPIGNRGLYVRLLSLFAGLFMQVSVFGQLSAEFSASTVSGCVPLVVQFTDQSTGNPTQWKWYLGNGNISVLKNPSATYFNPGTYTVKLVIYNASGSDSIIKSQFITVHASPVVNFSASDTTGCFPLNVQFTDLSLPGGGSNAGWNWDFGDGATSTVQHPSHSYSAAGNFNVTLKVTNSFGCSKTVSKSQYIKLTNGVTAGFSSGSNGQCNAPVSFNFQNSSTGPGSLSYSWDFGDGSISTATNPSHTYNTSGSYNVRLVTTSSQGCVDTTEQLISIGNLNSSFTVPDTVCVNTSFSISNTSSPVPLSSQWNFGDGNISNQLNPTHTYTSAGNYIIKLVNQFGSCPDSFSRSIVVVLKPLAAFNTSVTDFCKTPASVSFTNQSTGGNNFLWNFGDGSTSTEMNPVHIYNSEGNFTVTLQVFGANGCSDQVIKQDHIKIQKPQVTVTGFPQHGCIPLTVQPQATIISTEPVASWLWNFGDGSTSTDAQPSHTYTATGNYNVSLILTTTGGCTDTILIADAVKAGSKTQSAFSVNPVDVCAFQQVSFTDLTTGNPDQWFWNFGDGGSSTSQNPVYEYQDTGWFNVTLITWNNTCSDTVTINNAVHVKPPIANFTIEQDCINKYQKKFKDLSIGAESWTWNFGDGNTDTTQNPTHTYANPGSYIVSLTVTNGSCTHTKEMTVLVIDESFTLSASDTIVCKNVSLQLMATGINAANIGSWSWNFGDGSTSTTALNASHSYSASGYYTVLLTATDLNGCVINDSIKIMVYGPSANFSVNNAQACVDNALVTFTESSTTDGIHPIVNLTWNYGDGTIDSAAMSPYQHYYQSAGSYNVTLIVKDSYGCISQKELPAAVTISKPIADFNTADTLNCMSSVIQFTSTSQGNNLQHLWNFGDGNTSNLVNPTHTYTTQGSYSVSLMVTDMNGCSDTITKPGYINIIPPVAHFTVSDSVSSCPPLMVDFTNNSTSYVSVNWDFGDGTSSTMASPSHFYTMPGIYTATLFVSGAPGCTDSFTKRIEVKGPTGTFTYAPLTGCNPLTVSFTATTYNRDSIIWDFSDGNILSTSDSVVTHTYTTPGNYLPKMILIGDGCSVPIMGDQVISVYGAEAKFGLQNNLLCNSGSVSFTDSSFMNDAIVSYQWNFGDGQTSNVQHPTHHYSSPGNYTVSLIVTTLSGCVDTAIQQNAVRIFESPQVEVLGDSSACAPATISFQSNVIIGDSLSWQWNFGNGNVSNNPSPQTYSQAGTYLITAIVTDTNGCRDTVIKPLNIYPVPQTYAGPDAVACEGKALQLQASGAVTYLWNQTPDLSCTNCSAPLVAPAQTSTYVVVGTNAYGCSSTDSVKIRLRKPFVLQSPADDSICTGGRVHLVASGADQYNWSPSTGLDQPNSATPWASPSVTTTYTLIARDDDRCFSDTTSVTITVWPIPSIDAGMDQSIEVGNAIQLNTSSSADVSSWNWSPSNGLSCANCPNPVAQPSKTTDYKVKVQNAGGCKAEDQMRVIVTCGKGNLFIPNTFSPNSDGSNDRFFPRGSGIARIKSLRIYNRWGEIVFERINFNVNDAGAGWDGMFKGMPASPDVYVYTCEVVCMNSEVLEYKGDISLLR